MYEMYDKTISLQTPFTYEYNIYFQYNNNDFEFKIH